MAAFCKLSSKSSRVKGRELTSLPEPVKKSNCNCHKGGSSREAPHRMDKSGRVFPGKVVLWTTGTGTFAGEIESVKSVRPGDFSR